MTDKTPLKALFDISGNPIGLGEFNVGDSSPIEHGGTGKTSIGINKFWYASSANVLSETSITSAARSFLALSNITDMRSNLGLVIGTDAGQVITASTNGTLPVLDARNLKNVLPAGIIMFWSGSIGSIPTNFRLCDGNNGTPDLRDKFIVGAGLNYTPGAVGGATSHTHTVTVQNTTLSVNQMPSHTHPSIVSQSSGGSFLSYFQGSTTILGNGSTGSNGGDQPHSHGATVSTSSNLPPYYALAYIMSVMI